MCIHQGDNYWLLSARRGGSLIDLFGGGVFVWVSSVLPSNPFSDAVLRSDN